MKENNEKVGWIENKIKRETNVINRLEQVKKRKTKKEGE